MPVHDWSRVDAGTFHAFHTAWVTHLSEAMNAGLLPSGYYAMPEQHLGRSLTDVVILHAMPPAPGPLPVDGGLVVAEVPPKVRRKLAPSGSAGTHQRTLTIRRESDHRIVALVEIVSPANKDRDSHVDDMAAKVTLFAQLLGVHVLVADLFPPGAHDPRGIQGAIWEELDAESEPYRPPWAAPLTLASYVGLPEVRAYLQPLAVGDELPAMPLFLRPDRYVNVPLEGAYQAAFRGMPAFWREVLEMGDR